MILFQLLWYWNCVRPVHERHREDHGEDEGDPPGWERGGWTRGY